LNKPECSTSSIVNDGGTFEIYTLVTNNCESNPVNYTLIVTVIACVLVGLIIITLITVFLTPFKYVIFPKLRIRDDIKKKVKSNSSEERFSEVEHKIKELKSQITSLTNDKDRIKSLIDEQQFESKSEWYLQILERTVFKIKYFYSITLYYW